MIKEDLSVDFFEAFILKRIHFACRPHLLGTVTKCVRMHMMLVGAVSYIRLYHQHTLRLMKFLPGSMN